MKNVEVNIPKTTVFDDLTIIYKRKEEPEGQMIEIKTSKINFINELQYFRAKFHEINQQNELFIQDIYPIAIFREFIKSLTDKIILNESNYSDLRRLSIKYGYKKLLDDHIDFPLGFSIRLHSME